MRRSDRKRKPVETLLDYEDVGALKSEIKTEPAEVQFLDDAPHSSMCCCLCKASSSNKLAVFGTGPQHDPEIAYKIQLCSRLEISSEANPDAHICRGCLQQLDSHYEFQIQAMKYNEHALNQMAEAGADFDILRERIRVCRFCSINGQKLLNMYPDGESPEHDLLQKIRECLAIEVNSWDVATKICRNCIGSIDDLLEFRSRYLPSSEFLKEELWHYGPSKLAKRIKQENEDISNQDLDLSDSDCFSKGNEYTDPAFAGCQKLVAMRPEMVQLIGAEVDGKNYAVLSKDDEQMKVIFDDQRFRFHSERENGSSLWTCDNRDFRNCRMKIEIDATGKSATLSAGVGSHTHLPGTAKVVQCPLGKGMAEINGKAEPFYLLGNTVPIDRSITNYARSLIFQGYRYYRNEVRVLGVNGAWYCVQRYAGGCEARLVSYGSFHKVEIDGNHNHRQLADCKIQTLLQLHGIHTTSTEAISDFQNVDTIEKITEPHTASATEMSKRVPVEMKSLVKEKNPRIFQLLKQDDAERNFEVTDTGEILKVVQDSYEYRYYGELSDKSSVWKCIRETSRRCKLLSKITPDGKHLEVIKGKHNHGTELEDIFCYPLGKRMIGEEPLWLLHRFSHYNESRYIVYRDYMFYVNYTNQTGTVRWKCYKSNSCRALLFTQGNFLEVIPKNEHSHEKLPRSMIIRLINGSTKSGFDADNRSFKQKLLSYPLSKTKIWDARENDYETLYFLKDVERDTRSGFIFRRNKFSLASINQNGTSKWVCWKCTDPERRVKCTVVAIVKGFFETIVVAEQHTHEVMSDSMIERLIKQYASLPSSSGEKVAKLDKIRSHKRPTVNIVSILCQHDPDRNFTIARAKTNLLVIYKGVDFRLKSNDTDGISTWNCNWMQIRKCPVNLRMSADGKQVAYLDPQKQHNHADKQLGVFLQGPEKKSKP